MKMVISSKTIIFWLKILFWSDFLFYFFTIIPRSSKFDAKIAIPHWYYFKLGIERNFEYRYSNMYPSTLYLFWLILIKFDVGPLEIIFRSVNKIILPLSLFSLQDLVPEFVSHSTFSYLIRTKSIIQIWNISKTLTFSLILSQPLSYPFYFVNFLNFHQNSPKNLKFYFRCRIACKQYPRLECSGVRPVRNLDIVRQDCPVSPHAKRSKMVILFLSASVYFLCNKRNLYQKSFSHWLTNRMKVPCKSKSKYAFVNQKPFPHWLTNRMTVPSKSTSKHAFVVIVQWYSWVHIE